MSNKKQILVIDIGGTNVKMSLGGSASPSSENVDRFSTPPRMSPEQMVAGVKQAAQARDWRYRAITIGYPGPVKDDQPWREPVNLGEGWVAFDYAGAFGTPVKIINDAVIQALGSYHGGDMLFLGLGTGLGTAVICRHQIIPMEVAHLPFKNGKSFEEVLGQRGLDAAGEEVWLADLMDIVQLLSYAFCSDYVVLGGGNAGRLVGKTLPENVHLGDNSNAFVGGVLLWEDNQKGVPDSRGSTASPGDDS